MTGPANNRGNKPTLLNVIAMPIIIVAVIAGILIYNLVTTISVLVDGGEVVYDEEVLASYAKTEYEAGFKGKTDKKNVIMLFLCYDEDADQIGVFVQGGENIHSDAVTLFNSFAEQAQKNVNYKTELTKGITNALGYISTEYEKIDLKNAHIKNFDEKNKPKPQVIVKQGFPFEIKANEINAVLTALEAETEMPVIIVADTAAGVFGRTTPTMDIVILVLLAAVLALSIASLVKKIRNYKRVTEDFGTQEPSRIHVNARSPYYDEDDDEPIEGEASDVDGEADDEAESEDEVEDEAKETSDEE